MTLVCSKRPGRRSTQGASPLNMLSDRRVRKRTSPIHTKSGSAVSVQLDAAPHTVIAIASPAGRDENSCMPTHATPASVRPIHTPLARKANSTTMSIVVITTSFIVQGLLGRALHAQAAELQPPFIHERDAQ